MLRLGIIRDRETPPLWTEGSGFCMRQSSSPLVTEPSVSPQKKRFLDYLRSYQPLIMNPENSGWFRDVGFAFFEFLRETDRDAIRRAPQLKRIYNDEFKKRQVVFHCVRDLYVGLTILLIFILFIRFCVYCRNRSIRYPSFDSVLDGLQVFNDIARRENSIWFHFGV